MILRKTNAVLGLVATFLLLVHAISHGVWMLARVSLFKVPACMPWVLFGVMMLHAILSIVMAFLGHKGAEKRKCNGYANLNRPTNIQRMGGMLLIPLTVLHIAGTVSVLQPPPPVHAILPPLFFAITLIHVAISTGKSFITLGVGNAKTIKVIDGAMKLICAITLIVDVVGFCFYLQW